MSAAHAPHNWDSSYAGPPPPWDIGFPQPAFVRLAQGGGLTGALLDVGCGTGEHTILAALHGARALGIDVSPRAIGIARRKAAERGIDASFQVFDALHLDGLGETFDIMVDSGLFHVFDDTARTQYVAAVHAALRPGGHLHLMCFSDRQPGDWAPGGSPMASCAPRLAPAGGSVHSPPIASASTRGSESPLLKPGSRISSGSRTAEGSTRAGLALLTGLPSGPISKLFSSSRRRAVRVGSASSNTTATAIRSATGQ